MAPVVVGAITPPLRDAAGAYAAEAATLSESTTSAPCETASLSQCVERGHEEMPGPHRDVSDSEVEERRGRQVEIVADPAKVLVDCWPKGLVDQSIDCEHRRV